MLLIVEAVSKFGVLNAEDKKWYNPEDKDLLKTFKVGKGYDVELKENFSKGKRYLNIVTATEAKGVASAPPVVDKKPVTSKQVKVEVSGTDWAAKDRSQLVGGRSHDAVELVKASLQGCTPMAEILKLYKEALEGVLKIADEVK